MEVRSQLTYPDTNATCNYLSIRIFTLFLHFIVTSRKSDENRKYYCGKNNMVGVRFCDGFCGPNNGPNCNACRILTIQFDRYKDVHSS